MFSQRKPEREGPGLHKTVSKRIDIHLEPEAFSSIEGAALVLLKVLIPEKRLAVNLLLRNLEPDDSECRLVRHCVLIDQKSYGMLIDPDLTIRFHTEGGSVLFKNGKAVMGSLLFDDPLSETINRINAREN